MGNITASFTFSPNLQVATEEVTFTGTAETDAEGGTIDQWEWKFGNDGDIEIGAQQQTNTFMDPGNYNVWMRVTDSENDQETVGPTVVQITKKYRVTNLRWTRPGVRFSVTAGEYSAGNRLVESFPPVEQGIQNVEDQYDKCAERIWDNITDDTDVPSAAEVKAGIEAELHTLLKESL